MGFIQVIGEGPPASGQVRTAVEAVLQRRKLAFGVAMPTDDCAGSMARAGKVALHDTGSKPSLPILHIYLNPPAVRDSCDNAGYSHPEHGGCHARLLCIGAADAAVADMRAIAHTFDGSYRWTGSELQADGEPEFAFEQWLGMGVALAQARHAAQHKRHTLAAALLEWRRQLGKDIHSGPVQELVAGTFLTSLIPDGAGEPVLTQIQNALAGLRAICQRLNPPALDDFGLAAALRAVVRSGQQEQPNLNPKLDLMAELPELEPATARTLYVIFDRLLDALGQSESPASLARIRLAEQGAGVMLTIDWQPATGSFSVGDAGPHVVPRLPHAFLDLARELAASVGGRIELADSASPGSASQSGTDDVPLTQQLAVWVPYAGSLV